MDVGVNFLIITLRDPLGEFVLSISTNLSSVELEIIALVCGCQIYQGTYSKVPPELKLLTDHFELFMTVDHQAKRRLTIWP